MVAKMKFRARYAETDQMGVIHHSVYPIWFEVARGEFMRQFNGHSYQEVEDQGYMLPLSELSCRYLSPIHFDEEVLVEARLTKASAVKAVFSYKVFPLDKNGKKKHKKPSTTGSTTHGWVRTDTFEIVNMKKEMPALMEFMKKSIEEES